MAVADACVVIPTYNRAPLLEATLKSVAALDPAPREVIVVSDGSTDDTDAVVRRCGATLMHSDRTGAAGARNRGWRHTDADLIAFIDDDCEAEPSWLRHLLAPFADDTIGLVQGRTRPNGAVPRFGRAVDVSSEYGSYESCNIAYRRAALESVGGFNEAFLPEVRPRRGRTTSGGGGGFGEDTDLAWRVRRAGWGTTFAADALVHHAVFEGTFSEAMREEWRKGNFALLVREIPELADLLPGGPHLLRRQSLWAQGALLGLVCCLAGRRRVGSILAFPYAAWLVRTRQRSGLGEQIARDLVVSAALVAGSVRARRVLL